MPQNISGLNPAINYIKACAYRQTQDFQKAKPEHRERELLACLDLYRIILNGILPFTTGPEKSELWELAHKLSGLGRGEDAGFPAPPDKSLLILDKVDEAIRLIRENRDMLKQRKLRKEAARVYQTEKRKEAA